MTSTPEPTAAFATRSSITSLWSTRRSRRTPSFPSRDGATANGTATANTESRTGAKTNGTRHQEGPRKGRDEEAETWGFEASMGVGAGKPVKSDKEEELRGRILGKRRRETDGKGADEKGKGRGNEKWKGVGVDDSDSEEEVGRSALGRKKKKRCVDPVRPSGSEAKESAGAGEAKMEGPEANIQAKEVEEKADGKAEEEEWEGIKSSPPVDNPPTENTKPKRKKKKNKKRKTTE